MKYDIGLNANYDESWPALSKISFGSKDEMVYYFPNDGYKKQDSFFGTFQQLGYTSDYNQWACGKYAVDPFVKPVELIRKPFTVSTALDTFLIVDTTVAITNSSLKTGLICSSQPIPLVELPNDTLLCGSSFTLHAGIRNIDCKKRWSTGDTGMSITITSSGKYRLRSSYGACVSSDTIIVLFASQLPHVPDTVRFCRSDSFLLFPDTFPRQLLWISPKGDHITAANPWIKDTGRYILISSIKGVCDYKDTLQAMWHELPMASAGKDTTLCYMQSYIMQGSGGITYQWKPAYYLSNDTIANPHAQLPQSQRYLLIVSNEQGCRDSAYVMLQVKAPLQVQLHSASALQLCAGSSINIEATATGGDSSHYQYTWSNGEQGNQTTFTLQSSGYVQVTLDDGCSQPTKDSLYIDVLPPVEALFQIKPDTLLEGKDAITINKSLNANHYLWEWDSSSTTELSPIIELKDTGLHLIKLTAYNSLGCSDSMEMIVYVIPKALIYVPNVFTPGDDDGLNDVFAPISSGIKSYSLIIYNRWGEQLYTGENTGWDGTYKGQIVAEGVYIYRLIATDRNHAKYYLKGNLTLLRR